MKRLKNVGVFVLGAIIGWLIGSVIKYHEFPIIITGGQVGSIAEWLGAIGTIAAVIVALNNRWDFWAPIAENKLNRDIKEFNLRFNKQYRFINSYSIFSMYYTNLFEKLNDNQKINEQDLNTLKTLTKKL
ncbi:hypothetical protein ACLUW3_00005, partial [Limosilactobacillus reuteri subsp. suis]|uniref:hypothetical protein n=1 Tax=Limosilactobacillus reuteri TaxID=1598 RepID=UPI0039928D8C